MKYRFCQITTEQVRLLLFKECDWRGRKLLFDSSSIEKVPSGKNDKPTFRQTDELPCIVEVTDGFSYMYKGPSSDASVLGEMIFGAVAMNCRNVSLKIHLMDDPRRLMCTKIFFVPASRRVNKFDRRNDKREGSSCVDLRNESKPLSVPTMNEEGILSMSSSLGRGDSGFCGDNSPFSSLGSTHDYFCMFENCDEKEEFYSFHYPPGRNLSLSNNGSWQRRTFQNMATRFDLGSSSSLLSVPTALGSINTNHSDSQVYSNSRSGTNDSISSNSSAAQRKSKLGLALLITVKDSSDMELVRRCVEHSPQLQAVVCRLRLATLAAGAGRGFVSTLHRATENAARWLTDLMYGPRLQPMWLNLVTSNGRTTNKMAESLLSDLCSVLSVGDTKDTNFFISTLVTYVLTYHLGWVSTVSPYETVDHQKAAKITSDAKRPYNAMWAQLNDLCGSIGVPPRAARTIISGANNTQFVNRLLVVLTYFVRCGDVNRTDFLYQNVPVKETKVINVDSDLEIKKTPTEGGLKRTTTHTNKLSQCESLESLNVQVNTQNSDSVGTLVPNEGGLKKSSTHANLSQKLSSTQFAVEGGSNTGQPGQLKRNPTMMLSSKASSDSSLNSSISDAEPEQVVFVLGDDEKLVGLKNKSASGKSVKKSSKIHNEQLDIENNESKDKCKTDNCEKSDSTSKCCGLTLQHSKPIKHSGFKFEFDKYPQIVTNYMKSKNLEILDRHYIGKPGNLKLDNYQFDPMVVLPIQEEKCETCDKCQLMESMLQTPTNASEMEYMNDIPRQSEPQHAKETIVGNLQTHRELSPKTFVRVQQENTLIVNVPDERSLEPKKPQRKRSKDKIEKQMKVKQVIEFPLQRLHVVSRPGLLRSGYDASLLGGITDHYVPDLVLQGTLAKPSVWEMDLRRDLDLLSHLNKSIECSLQSIAIIGDTNTWEVHIVGRDCGSGGMSSLVGSMLDALPIMWKAKVPAHQCVSFMEGKLREFCVLSKTLAEMLMSTDFCDIATLTKSLNIDVNDVPLLLAVATTHTPQVATKYGISYR